MVQGELGDGIRILGVRVGPGSLVLSLSALPTGLSEAESRSGYWGQRKIMSKCCFSWESVIGKRQEGW